MCRGEGRFRLPLTEGIQRKAQELFEALAPLPAPLPRLSRSEKRAMGGDSPSRTPERSPFEGQAVLKLQEFFFAAITDSISESQDDQFRCPVQAYVACFAYNGDDTFKLASGMTPMLAQWEFLIRCTVLFAGHQTAEDKSVESVVR